MNKYYMEVNAIQREIVIYCSEMTDKSESLSLSDAKVYRYQFNELLYLAEEYVRSSFLKEMNDICNTMVEYVDLGKKENDQITEQYHLLRSKYNSNIIAIIYLDILYDTYDNQRYNVLHLGLLKSAKNIFSKRYFKMAKEIINSKYDIICKETKKMKYLAEGNFEQIPDSGFYCVCCTPFRSKPHFILYSLNESIDPLIQVFLSKIEMAHLNVFVCRNCRRKYLDVSDVDYCPNPACQEEKQREEKRIKLQNRKNNIFANELDKFNIYARHYKRELTRNGIDGELLLRYTEEQDRCRYDIQMEISVYQNTNKPIDNDLIAFIEHQKSYLKSISDDILIRLGFKQQERIKRRK